MSGIAWFKLYTGLFDNEKLKFIETMENRDTIVCILIKLFIQAAKTNDKGLIYFNQETPYTNEMFSIIFNRPLDAIESAFKVLSDFKTIEIDENNFVKICNWEKYQNIEGMEKVRAQTKKRVEDHRAKKKEKENFLSNEMLEDELDNEKNCEPQINNREISFAKNCNVTVTQQKENKIENKNKNEIKKENKSELENKDNDKSKSLSPEPKKQKNEKAANELLEHYKKNSIKIIGLNLNALKNCISIHGKDNARFAIDKSLELNKPSMKYINGILKNWKREGYPVLDNIESNYTAGNGKSLRFNNFKPREYDYDSLEKALLGWDQVKLDSDGV